MTSHPQPHLRRRHGCTVGVNRDPPVWCSHPGRMMGASENRKKRKKEKSTQKVKKKRGQKRQKKRKKENYYKKQDTGNIKNRIFFVCVSAACVGVGPFCVESDLALPSLLGRAWPTPTRAKPNVTSTPRRKGKLTPRKKPTPTQESEGPPPFGSGLARPRPKRKGWRRPGPAQMGRTPGSALER